MKNIDTLAQEVRNELVVEAELQVKNRIRGILKNIASEQREIKRHQSCLEKLTIELKDVKIEPLNFPE